MGVLQWLDLLNRCKLSIYDDVYTWVRCDDPDLAVPAPATVLQELASSLVLGSTWPVDLTRPVAEMIAARDASQSFGFGASVYHCTQDEARDIARLSERRGDYVRLRREEGDEPECPRIGQPHKLDIGQHCFQDVLSIRARKQDFPGVLELNAVVLLIEWFLRSSSHQHCRLPLLIDAKAVLGGIVKGRSSSGPFLRLLRRLASLLIIGDLMLCCVYIPSEDNPADAPSRGRRRR